MIWMLIFGFKSILVWLDQFSAPLSPMNCVFGIENEVKAIALQTGGIAQWSVFFYNFLCRLLTPILCVILGQKFANNCMFCQWTKLFVFLSVNGNKN